MRLLVTCTEGTSQLVADECAELGVKTGKVRWDGVEASGSFKDLAKLLVWSRTAERVLVQMRSVECTDAKSLYEGTKQAKWLDWVDSTATIGVMAMGKLPRDGRGPNALRTHVFAAQRIKDAIVDELRDEYSFRPDIEIRDPDVQIIARFFGNRCNIYLDASAAPLNRRGYRFTGVPGAVSETLAAAALLDAGFEAGDRLINPMCGGGTIAIEAALIHAGLAPNAERSFGCERWPVRRDEVRKALDEVRKDARKKRRKLKKPRKPPIIASDIDAGAIKAAKDNAATAGVDGFIRIEQADVTSLDRPGKGELLAAAVPDLEQLSDGRDAFFAGLGEHFATFGNSPIALLSGEGELPKSFGLRADRTVEFRSGRRRSELHHFNAASSASRDGGNEA